TFNDPSIPTSSKVTWDWGDGTSFSYDPQSTLVDPSVTCSNTTSTNTGSTGCQFHHTYSLPGSYTAVFNDGATTASITVNVSASTKPSFTPTFVPLSSITSVSAFYTALYKCILGRAPGTYNDPGGLAYWIKGNSSFATLYQPYASFFDSAEYLADNTSDREYVSQLFQCVLYRQPDAWNLNSWLQELGNGTSRDTVLQNVVSSVEFQTNDEPTLGSVTGLAY
ncbi:MAG TPA: DUF4214 domain-containing protein, partial [Candidatus Paceibacterota bacterium]|nr:DUF4214 domain-containing protein [Candidatus Paceibacterota bacterium]